MNWIKNTTIILTSSLITLIFAEIFLRFFNIGYGNAPLNNSRVYHHAHPQNYTFTVYDPNEEYGGHTIHYDENGFRSNPAPSKKPIENNGQKAVIFLGDSFTEGNQVKYESTFPHLVGKNLGVKHMNLGVSSYSPIIYRLQVINILPRLDESNVIIQLFSNDFADDQTYRRLAIFEDRKIIAIDGGGQNWFKSFVRKIYLLRFLRKAQIILQHSVGQNEQEQGNLKYNNDLFLIEQNIHDNLIKYSINILEDIKKILQDQGKTLSVMIIPSKFLSKRKICCLDDKLYKRVVEQLKHKKINVINLAEEFEQHTNQQLLFFEKDIHLTEEGNRVVAEAITKHLRTTLN